MPDDLNSVPVSRHGFAAELKELVLAAEHRAGRRRRFKRSALARRIDMSVSSLYAYLNGTTLPPADVLARLFDALGVADADRQRLAGARESLELRRRSRLARVRRDPTVPRQLHAGVPGSMERGGLLDDDRTATCAIADARTPPLQLPLAIADFAGRDEQLRRLCDLLSADASPAVVVAAVGGGGGIGKTTLAVQAGHLMRQRYPDGQLYANLRGAAGVDVSVAGVPAGFLRALDVPPSAIPDALTERSALYRSRLAGRRVLVVLDDVASAAQSRPLLPGSETSGVVITSRSRLADLEGVQLIDLDVLAADEALTLLSRVAGRDRIAAEPSAATRLVELCGGLPLAVRIAGARLAARPGWSIQTLTERLTHQHRRLDELAVGDLAVRASFELSYQGLTADQARAFRLMGALDWTTMPLVAVATLLDVPAVAADRIVEQLVDGYLLEAVGPDRFQLHDLLRLFAREQCIIEESDSDRAGALTRVLRCYLATLRNAFRLLCPAWRVHRDHTDGYPGRYFADHAEGMLWLETERANVRQLIDQACRHREVPVALIGRVLECMRTYQSLGYLTDCEHAAQAVLARALHDQDRSAEATARLTLGCLAGSCGIDFEHAIDQLRRSVALSEATNDLPIWIRSCNMLGCLYFDQQRYDDATRLFGQLLERCQQCNDLGGQGTALCNLGATCNQQDEPAQALAYLQPALELAHQTDDPSLQAAILDDMGTAYRRLHRYDDAARCYADSLDLYRSVDDTEGEALSLLSHAEADLDQGQAEAALGHCQEALKLSQRIGLKEQARSLLVLGRAYHDLGDIDQARTCWHQSLAGFEAIHAAEAADVLGLLEP